MCPRVLAPSRLSAQRAYDFHRQVIRWKTICRAKQNDAYQTRLGLRESADDLVADVRFDFKVIPVSIVKLNSETVHVGPRMKGDRVDGHGGGQDDVDGVLLGSGKNHSILMGIDQRCRFDRTRGTVDVHSGHLRWIVDQTYMRSTISALGDGIPFLRTFEGHCWMPIFHYLHSKVNRLDCKRPERQTSCPSRLFEDEHSRY